MDSSELEAIRAARAQQLKQESTGGAAPSGGPQPSEDAQQSAADDTRRDVLASLLEPIARERCVSALVAIAMSRSREFTSCSLRPNVSAS